MTRSDSNRKARRPRTLIHLDEWLEPTMVLLGIVWLLECWSSSSFGA